jgi:hypothetical protein
MVCFLFFTIPTMAAETVYRPDSHGFIRNWLILGPYPSYKTEGGPAGYDDDLLKKLGGELKVEPFIGLKDEAVFVADKGKLIAGIGSTNEWGFTETKTVPVEWRELHWTQEKPVIDIYNQFGDFRDNIVSYVACYVILPKDQTVQIRLGSDDDYKLFVNHEYIGGLMTNRAAEPNSNIHIVKFNRGSNLVMLKVVNRSAGYQFCLAVTDGKGLPISGMEIRLEDPKVKCLKLCPTIGRVDAAEGKVFGRFDLDGEEPYFIGSRKVKITLGSLVQENEPVTFRIKLADGSSLIEEKKTLSFEPGKPVIWEKRVTCTQPGPLTLSAEFDSGTNLTRLITLLDPMDVKSKLSKVKSELAKIQRQKKVEEDKLKSKISAVKMAKSRLLKQYSEIEQTYAARRAILEKMFGDAGHSIDVSYTSNEASPRETICLNGDTWQLAPAKKQPDGSYDGEVPPKDGWEGSRVPIICMNPYFRNWFLPVTGQGGPYGPTVTRKCAGNYKFNDARLEKGIWYRLSFNLPKDWEKGYLELILVEAKVSEVRVYLNGTLCGSDELYWGNKIIPLKGAKAGSNTLEIFTSGTNLKGNKLENWGLVGDILLQKIDTICVRDVWPITSWRNSELRTRTWIENHEKKPVKLTIKQFCVAEGRIRKIVGESSLTVQPETIYESEQKTPWTDAKVWGIGGEYGEPNLYQLVTEIRDDSGKLRDRQTTRFGFREFWVEGTQFYLNGKRIILQGDIGFPYSNLRSFMSIFIPLIRQYNINILRMHDSDQDTEVLPDVADEMGMLVYAQMYPELDSREGALSPEEFLASPLHQKNLQNYARMVKMFRNHPSVVIYSTDNEIFTQAWDKPDKLASNIRNDRIGAFYEKFVKQMDPTRVMTRDGDEGTWGHKGKWQEDPPCDTANYHYPEFDFDNFVRNWETVYDMRPVIFGETMYTSYGSWNGWCGAQPTQVTNKAASLTHIMKQYRDFEIPGAIYMGLSSDGFIELSDSGAGPWKVTPAMRQEYKTNEIIKSLPYYPYAPIFWPSMSGLGIKWEFANIDVGSYGWRAINWFDPSRPMCIPNAVNAVYKSSLLPMPPVKTNRSPELLVKITKAGQPVAGAMVTALPLNGVCSSPCGVMTDSKGLAWLLFQESGIYKICCSENSIEATVKDISNDPLKAGFDYLPVIELKIQ